jgi:hypothetical protein
MGIFNVKKNITDNLEKTLGGKLKVALKELHRDVQGWIDSQTSEETTTSYSGNRYRKYETAVKAVSDKYNGDSAWGCDLTGDIVDFRAAVTVSSGPQFKPAEKAMISQKDDQGKAVNKQGKEDNPKIQAFASPNIEDSADREMDFCRDFFDVNNINHETPQELGKEAEIEGRVAVELKWDPTAMQVILVHKPWTVFKYRETRNKLDPKRIDKIEWDAQGTDIVAGSCEGDKLVCRWFSGRLSAKFPMTKIMRCLTKIENLDQGFRDWREIDRLYAAPIPIFECKTDEEAERMSDAIKAGLNFKIKKAFALNGTFKYVGPEMTGIDSLELEIKRLACFVSGTTGYPLQFLLPDMLSNRSTSENIMESALVQTASERAIWIGFYEELIKKAMIMYAANTSKTPLDSTKVSVTIPQMTNEQWTRLTTFWLPAFKDDLITREAALSQIPGFDLREEMDRRAEADQSQVARVTAEIDKMKTEADQNPPDKIPGKQPDNFGKGKEAVK